MVLSFDQKLQYTYGDKSPAGRGRGLFETSLLTKKRNVTICFKVYTKRQDVTKMNQSCKMSITIYSHILRVFKALDMSEYRLVVISAVVFITSVTDSLQSGSSSARLHLLLLSLTARLHQC